MLLKRFAGFPVVAYDLSEYKEILEPFCNNVLLKEGNRFTLGNDYEVDRMNVWEVESKEVNLMAAIFDSYCLQYLQEEHPKYKGKPHNYSLEKDAWLTTPETKQHVRIHTHTPPFIREDDVGDLITIFYVYLDASIGFENGPFELYQNPESAPAHVWVPKHFSLLLMPPDVWHRARPFRGERYSLATDIKVSIV